MKNVILDGWLHTDRIRDVFTEAFRDVREKLQPDDRHISERELEAFLEKIRLDLFAKATRTKEVERPEGPYKETPDSRNEHLAFRAGRLGRGTL